MTHTERPRLTKREVEKLTATLAQVGSPAEQLSAIMAVVVPLLDRLAGAPRPWNEHVARLTALLDLSAGARASLADAQRDPRQMSDPSQTLMALWDVVAYLNEMRSL